MTTVFEALTVIADQAQPCFMDQCSGLEGLAGSFVGQFVRREPAQLLINERK
jgi:hypothetical protein